MTKQHTVDSLRESGYYFLSMSDSEGNGNVLIKDIDDSDIHITADQIKDGSWRFQVEYCTEYLSKTAAEDFARKLKKFINEELK